jgi:hypothetical protein
LTRVWRWLEQKVKAAVDAQTMVVVLNRFQEVVAEANIAFPQDINVSAIVDGVASVMAGTASERKLKALKLTCNQVAAPWHTADVAAEGVLVALKQALVEARGVPLQSHADAMTCIRMTVLALGASLYSDAAVDVKTLAEYAVVVEAIHLCKMSAIKDYSLWQELMDACYAIHGVRAIAIAPFRVDASTYLEAQELADFEVVRSFQAKLLKAEKALADKQDGDIMPETFVAALSQALAGGKEEVAAIWVARRDRTQALFEKRKEETVSAVNYGDGGAAWSGFLKLTSGLPTIYKEAPKHITAKPQDMDNCIKALREELCDGWVRGHIAIVA